MTSNLPEQLIQAVAAERRAAAQDSRADYILARANTDALIGEVRAEIDRLEVEVALLGRDVQVWVAATHDALARPSTDEVLGVAPDWTGDKSVDDYIDEERTR